MTDQRTGSGLDWAAEEARTRGLPMTVIHVFEVFVGGPVAMPLVDLRSLAQETLDGGVDHVRKEASDVPVQGVLVQGQAAAKLIEAGKTAAMIVLGPRGLGGFRRWCSGRSAPRWSRTPLPRGDRQRRPGHARPCRGRRGRFTDLPGRAGAGVRRGRAARILRPRGGGLGVGAGGRPSAAGRRGRHAQGGHDPAGPADDPLRELHPGVDAQAEIVVGPPREVLLDAARDARLLVVGSRGLGGFAACYSDRSAKPWSSTPHAR